MEELQKLNELNNLLTSALSEYKKRGFDYAKAYRNYRVKVAQKLLELKAERMPVTILWKFVVCPECGEKNYID